MDWSWLLQHADPSIDWPYAMITLIVRFIGVFLVMLVMQVALQVAARVVKRIEAPKEQETAPTPEKEASRVQSLDVSSLAEENPDMDWAEAAAIGMALEIETSSIPRPVAGTSSWAVNGRIRQLDRLRRD